MAEEVGVEYGQAMAAAMGGPAGRLDRSPRQRSFRTALHAVADALTAHGFAAHAERTRRRAAHRVASTAPSAAPPSSTR